MKVVLFTPALAASAIGGISVLIEAELLNAGHDVAIIRTEDADHIQLLPHPFEADLVRWDDRERVAALTREAGAIIYQIGDNYTFHAGCLEWLPSAPGIVCLHDFFVGHLFWDWAEHHRIQAEAIVRIWYGEDVAQRFFASQGSTELIANAHDSAPMTEWIASMALGVLTHSRWGIHRVLGACPGPVMVAPLLDRGHISSLLANSLPATNTGANTGASASTLTGAGEDRDFIVLTIGHMNANKRQMSVIRALGSSALLRSKARYHLVGQIETRYAQQLTALAHRLGVQLSIAGVADDLTFAQALEQATVVCCLRYPVLESASASAIEAMRSAKATIVTDVGFYSELPDNYVCKVSPDHEIEDLQRILEWLYLHPEAREAIGARASTWARETFSAAKYVEQILRMNELTMKAEPAIKAARFFADTLKRWGASEAFVESQDVLAYLTPLSD